MRVTIENQIESLKKMEAVADTEWMKGYISGSIEAYKNMLEELDEEETK